jgi:hypothetical protein
MRTRFLSVLLLSSILAGLFSACASSPPNTTRTIDDALLLALASHEQLDLLQEEARSSNIGGDYRGVMVANPNLAAKENPQGQVAGMYARFARTQAEGSTTREYFENKAVEHTLMAQALTDSRVKRDRRRGRGFQNFFRKAGRTIIKIPKAVIRVTGKLLKGTLEVAKIAVVIAAEHIPQMARDYVMQKLRDLRDLAQGKINLTWDKLAGKLGVPFAIWLRSRIDPAFVRLRDRIVAKVLGRKRQPTETKQVFPTETRKSAADEGPSPLGEPTATEETLPIIVASGSFSEQITGTVHPDKPLGITFKLTADFAQGSVTGNLSGGRTTSGNPFNCVDSADQSILRDTAYVDYTDAYTANFNGALNPENGEFSLKISPKGATTDRMTTPFTKEGCLHLNGQPAPGSIGWTGNGTISGFIDRDGYIEFTTHWTSYGGNIEVSGSWNGGGEVVTP